MNLFALFLSGFAFGVVASISYAHRARRVVELMRQENRALVARNAELRRDMAKVEDALGRAHGELQRRCNAPTIIEAIIKNKNYLN